MQFPISCADKTISNSARGDYNFSDLNSVSVGIVYLFSCNGATISSNNDSVAGNLAYLTGGGVWAIIGGSISAGTTNFVHTRSSAPPATAKTFARNRRNPTMKNTAAKCILAGKRCAVCLWG